MKRDRFRRLAAMMLAAATLWVTAAAMGSDSLRDAAAAVRDSVRLPETLLRWELGDMAAADTLALPALLALRESPLLLSAWADVAALPQDGTAPEKTPAAPVPVTPAPQPEAEPSGHEDNGAASQTIAPASPSGFVQVGDVFIKNNSTKALEPGRFDGTFAAKLSEDAPQVLIVHTHGSEAYTMPPGEEYEDTGSFRTADASVSVIRVGDELARVLSGYGISVLHDRALYDDPEYNGAYYRAEDAIEAYMEKYPSIGFILDVHRDALEDKAGHQYKVVTREDPDCAQVSLVMGSSWEGWQENLKFAVAVQQHLTERYPTLMRPLTLRNSDYNEYFTPGSLLVEIGAAGNSLDEALKAVRVFGEGFAEVVTGK